MTAPPPVPDRRERDRSLLPPTRDVNPCDPGAGGGLCGWVSADARPTSVSRGHSDMLLPCLVGLVTCVLFISPSVLFHPLACGLVWAARLLESV